MDQKSGYCSDGVFRSLRQQLVLPQDPNASMIPFLFRNISSHPNRPAIIDSHSGETLTFSQFKTIVAKLSHALNTLLGITKNDVVLLFAPNSIHYPICSYAIIALGAILTTANPELTPEDLLAQIQDSKPKLIITVQELYQNVENFGLPVVILSSENSRNGWFSYKDLILSSGSISELPNVSIQGDDPAALLYSDQRFGVILSHKNFIAASQMVTSDQNFMGEMERDSVHLCLLPMFHVFAFAIVLYSQLQQGNTVVSMGKFSYRGVLKNIGNYKVTHLWVVPHVILAYSKQVMFNKFHMKSLKAIISSGAPLGKRLIEVCAQRFPGVLVLQGYGMTETTGAISMGNLGHRHSGSTGRLLPGIEARIVRLYNSMPPNHFGEIWVRGATTMLGYLNNPQATSSTIDEYGFVHTGDLGYFDDEGQLFVVGRINEVILFQVAPAELEARLLSHSKILDAAVIPFPDNEADEVVPIAFVVLYPNGILSEEDVKRFIADQVGPYFQMKRVMFVDSIPKSASGKILRHVLLEQVLSRM